MWPHWSLRMLSIILFYYGWNFTDIIASDVIYKLLAFTAAMVFGPIGMYFLTVNSIFGGKIMTKILIHLFHQVQSN